MINVIYQKVKLCLDSYNRETILVTVIYSFLLFSIFPEELAIIILIIGYLIYLFFMIFDKSIKKISHYSTTCIFFVIVISFYLLLGQSQSEYLKKHSKKYSKNSSIIHISSLVRVENNKSGF